MNGTTSSWWRPSAAITAVVVFMSMMIVLHEGAIAMAAQAGDGADHDEPRGPAPDMTTERSTEVSHFNHWQQEWYRLEPHRRQPPGSTGDCRQ